MNVFHRGLAFFCLGVAVASPNVVHAAEEQLETPASAQPLRPVTQTIQRLDSQGEIHSIEPRVRQGARVFVFLSGECPISKAYVPELKRLAEGWNRAEAENSVVTLQGIWSDATTAPAAIARFVKEHEIGFPILLDRDGELARCFAPTHVPEAFVLDAEGRLAYRGRIDDLFPELGKRRPEATEHTLRDAVASVIKGAPPEKSVTEPVGCLFEDLPQGARKISSGEPEVTWTRDVAPILFANCVSCHREGEVGPFPLMSYEDAAKRARQLARVTDRKLMPPWMPTATHGEFEGQRTLTDRQIETLRLWSEGGRTQGASEDLPPAPQFASGWRLGTPDMILEMPETFELRADGPDLFQNFVIPIDIPHDKLVAAVDFIPGNSRIVHHSLLFLDVLGRARALDAKTPEPGYSTFGGPGFLPSGSIGGWSLGKTPKRLPNGLGRYLKKGSDLVMQVHYHPSGKVETDRSKVGVYFVDRPKNVAADIWVGEYTHDIPPGESNYRVATSYTLPDEVEMLGVVPHMHLLGRTMRVFATLPDGTQQLLIEIPRWDFNWQDDYRFARPFKLPKGTKIDVEAVYDNSADNLSNPSSPPQRVLWGEQTTNEMLYCFFLVATEEPKGLIPIVTDVLKREMVGTGAARLRLRALGR